MKSDTIITISDEKEQNVEDTNTIEEKSPEELFFITIPIFTLSILVVLLP